MSRVGPPEPVNPNAERISDYSQQPSPALTPLSAVRYGGEQLGKTPKSRFYSYEENNFSSGDDEDDNDDDFSDVIDKAREESDGKKVDGEGGVARPLDFDSQDGKLEFRDVREDLEFHRLLHRHTLQHEQMEENKRMSEKAAMDKELKEAQMDLQKRQYALEVINQAIEDLERSSKNHEAMVAEKQENLKYLIEKQEKQTVQDREELNKDFSERKTSERKSMSELQQSIILMNRALKEQKERMEAEIKETTDAFLSEKEDDLNPEIERWAEANRKNAEILKLIEQVKMKYNLTDEDNGLVW
eukprot:CAMPEP_0117758664 /NCGR_PEP_ID=MMETSP0947-20121206/15532_1 /TAXON_ID=44440 /ORGANISM="Chattonella subsalsa, Strain CCMP2191" /LENGTH=300 /DNA_ID=CAMNT_0005578933 /DNA_START=240 /DNA_END=1139 /DNA_ORIENTATION=-